MASANLQLVISILFRVGSVGYLPDAGAERTFLEVVLCRETYTHVCCTLLSGFGSSSFW